MHHMIDYRPPRVAVALVAAAILIHLSLPLSWHAKLPLPGTITALLGFCLMLRAWWLFKLASTAICPTATATALLTHDVYAFSRNPMYLGMLLMLLGLSLAIGGAAFYLATLTYAAIIDRVFVRHEQQKSLQEFGEDYIAYTKRVRRWL